ncbi:response regulator transcription factor [Sphingomonas bacterium]|uniref:response regulator transcription factor n=1 Tax=Sphingomonas bacterium TaxID=1895847 RepID=UPI0015761252|nr:response regulator transcription factor [Sphingomonas bacterium]
MQRDNCPEGTRPTILVVDDAPDSLRLLTATLERAGMTVLIARGGQTALDLLRHVNPDLVLMDAMMPGLDGFETTRRIKAMPSFKQLPIIFMTGLSETEDVVRGLGAGAVDYVSKPIVIDELLARISVHLATARVAHGSQSALDTSGRPALAVDDAGRLLWLTPVASEMLQRVFADWSPASGNLPRPFLAAIRSLQESAPASGTRATIDRDGGMIEAEFLRRTAASQWLFLLSQRRGGEDERLLAARHGLTSREAEVLLWISRGKQNREVSEILKISPRTVNKHLEQIFEKMGIENRASATAIAVATLTRA